MKKSAIWIASIGVGMSFIAIFLVFFKPSPVSQSLLTGSAVPLSTVTQATTDPTTWKGVNLPLKFHGVPNSKVLTQADFDRAAALGANVIRLDVHADPAETLKYSTFVDSQGVVIPAATSPGMADIKAAVTMAAKDNLKVIIDLHSSPGTLTGEIWNNQADWVTLQKLWAMITNNYKNNPTVVAFDLMNEPTLLTGVMAQDGKAAHDAMYKAMVAGTWTIPTQWAKTPRDYNFQMAFIIRTIRTFDPSRTVVVEGFGQVGQPINFTWMKPIDGLDNIVYSFHMYIPADLVDIGRPDVTTPAPFKYPQDESKITNAFAPVLAFQQKYNVPIWVGEFGIEDPAIFTIDPPTKLPYNGACWISSVMKTMDTNHWGWTLWDLWTPGRIPVSAHDPRYLALSSDMKNGVVPDYCANPPVLDSTPSPLPLLLGPTPVDTTPPVITLLGGDMTLSVGQAFTDPGATAVDDVDGTITPSASGTVDVMTPGTYTRVYSASDKAGNTSTATRTIVVKASIVTGGGGTGGGSTGGSGGGVGGCLAVCNIVSSVGGIVETVNQPLNQPVSNVLTFHVEQAPVVAPAPVIKKAPTKAPQQTVTVTQVPAPIPSGSSIAAIDYAINNQVLHTTTSFPDTWNFDTTTLRNTAYTLTETYHYGDGSTRSSVTVVFAHNTKTFWQNISDVVYGVWQGIKEAI